MFFKKNQKGFTLMEMVVSISIMVFLTSLFLVNYRVGSKKTELTLATQKTVSDIRFAQSASLGSINYSGQSPLGGWGIHIDTSSGNNDSYTIFADVNGNHAYDGAGESNASFGGRVVDLPENIFFDSIHDALGNSDAWSDFIFLPPDSETIIWDGSATTTSATIRLRHLITGDFWDVIINVFGLIELNHV